jgi:hypothetical protein
MKLVLQLETRAYLPLMKATRYTKYWDINLIELQSSKYHSQKY